MHPQVYAMEITNYRSISLPSELIFGPFYETYKDTLGTYVHTRQRGNWRWILEFLA